MKRMNTKVVIPIALLAIVLPAIGMIGIQSSDQIEAKSLSAKTHLPIDVDGEKLVSITHADYRIFTFPEMIERSDAIVIGTLTEGKSFVETETNDRYPTIFTTHDLKVDRVIKGDSKTTNYPMQTWGGITAERDQIMEDRMELVNQKQVLVFLEQNLESPTFGTNYYPVSEKYGILEVVDGQLYQQGEKRPIPLDEFIKAIHMELDQ
ncbi:MAG: hypothetical protein J4F36_14045 [Nitrosopumilaceae archaeon]|nr:hypothetical protein [Nitrosopumilaceae archaeon]